LAIFAELAAQKNQRLEHLMPHHHVIGDFRVMIDITVNKKGDLKLPRLNTLLSGPQTFTRLSCPHPDAATLRVGFERS
jgi:hypothetical protein